MAERKAKRQLKNIDFSKDGAHLALVSKDQGGPANGHDYALVIKSLNFSPEFITKMQQVRVTLELPEFLRRFFHLYDTDAEVLARMMGYVEKESEDDDEEFSYDKYIQERVDQFEILKALHSSDNKVEAYAKLTEDKYESILKQQAILEEFLDKIEKNSVKPEEGVIADKSKVTPSEPVTKGNKMDEKEVIELQKSFAAQQEQLTKALEIIEVFKAEKQAAIVKARQEKLAEVVKDADKAAVLFKALGSVESDEVFAEVVKTLGELTASVEKSDLFKETGTTVDTEESVVKESPVAKAVKAKLAGK